MGWLGKGSIRVRRLCRSILAGEISLCADAPLLYLHNFNGSRRGNWNTPRPDSTGGPAVTVEKRWNKDKVANGTSAATQTRQIWRGKWNVNWDAGRLFSPFSFAPSSCSFPWSSSLSLLNKKKKKKKEERKGKERKNAVTRRSASRINYLSSIIAGHRDTGEWIYPQRAPGLNSFESRFKWRMFYT